MKRGFCAALAALVGVACAARHTAEAPSAQSHTASVTAESDSAIYAAFLETLNRDPERDTLHVEELSKTFGGFSAHYDSVAPGLVAALQKMSEPKRPTTSLHLPPPIRLIAESTAVRLADSGLLGALGAVPDRPQGTRGLWAFTPVAYSADGNDAMFAYSEYCGRTCGEDVVVWARKNTAGRWEVRRTAILVIY